MRDAGRSDIFAAANPIVMDQRSRIWEIDRVLGRWCVLASVFWATVCLCAMNAPSNASATTHEPLEFLEPPEPPYFERPFIGPLTYGQFGPEGTTTVSAVISPEGLETTYRITLECEVGEVFAECDPSQFVEGLLPATHESYEENLHLTGLKQSDNYRFGVQARNSERENWMTGEIGEIFIPPGAGSECVGCDEPYETKESQWAIESGNEAAARTLQEAREEEHAKEAAKLAEEAADKQTEERPPVPACVVPTLRGDTLAVARRALRRAHCRTGKLSRPRRYRGPLAVDQQRPRAGKKLADGAAVALSLRPAAANVHKRHA
jgi:hypothetical protein